MLQLVLVMIAILNTCAVIVNRFMWKSVRFNMISLAISVLVIAVSFSI
jgi:hypothetical protein